MAKAGLVPENEAILLWEGLAMCGEYPGKAQTDYPPGVHS
ncbi:unnamed protein product [marine sediment metagenome]|uniref:Uncharacterized protein n=1 Tax=marine sediment metagenome TaxID=412755 RepID=X1L284_9ZZZZ